MGIKNSGGDAPFMGHRIINTIDGKSVAGPYKWETYNQVFERVKFLG
jgi:hypothetical protein